MQPNEEILQRAPWCRLLSPTSPSFQSRLLLTNQRVLEVKVSLGSALIGKKRVSSVSVGLDEILQCDFRKGKMVWKSGSRNLVVLSTGRGEFAWATLKGGHAFVAEVNTVLQRR